MKNETLVKDERLGKTFSIKGFGLVGTCVQIHGSAAKPLLNLLIYKGDGEMKRQSSMFIAGFNIPLEDLIEIFEEEKA